MAVKIIPVVSVALIGAIVVAAPNEMLRDYVQDLADGAAHAVSASSATNAPGIVLGTITGDEFALPRPWPQYEAGELHFGPTGPIVVNDRRYDVARVEAFVSSSVNTFWAPIKLRRTITSGTTFELA